jgi:hypothetical protein
MATLFKKKHKNTTIHFDNGVAYFHNGRFATNDTDLENEIKAKLKEYKIFIDPEEPEVDLGDKSFEQHVNDAIVQELINGPSTQTVSTEDVGVAGVGVASTANNPSQNGAVPRFANATAAQLKARLASSKTTSTSTTDK